MCVRVSARAYSRILQKSYVDLMCVPSMMHANADDAVPSSSSVIDLYSLLFFFRKLHMQVAHTISPFYHIHTLDVDRLGVVLGVGEK